MKASWENTILAESAQTVTIEGNHYFPPIPSARNTFCRVPSITLAHGKVRQATTTSVLPTRQTPTRPGITRNQRKPLTRLKITGADSLLIQSSDRATSGTTQNAS